jgi:hypothetical protein
MARTLSISFATPSDTHRVRNFAEDLSRALTADRKLGTLPMEQADAAVDRVIVVGVALRQVARTTALVRKLLAAHNYGDEASVSSDR